MSLKDPINPAKTKRATSAARNLRVRDTWAERLVWKWLRDRNFSAYKFRRQYTYGPHILDFFCVEALLDIEIDGRQHGKPDQLSKDKERDEFLIARGIKVLRFWNSRLRREHKVIRNLIWATLQSRAPQPMPEYCRTQVSVDKNKPETVTK